MSKIGDSIRVQFMEMIGDFLITKDKEVLLIKSNVYSIPWVVDGEEGYINITFSIPKGARNGEGYDGYAEAENYKMLCDAKAKKKIADAEAKKKKIVRDTKRRADIAANKEKENQEKSAV